ncbi:hypothetical protein FALBO_13385 [Fusarium albosuccineum]|uniref:Uncharacterized protein n=1 Tax=Fusarium albosuccineum TaxID=1237068 RepID=A0A8H4P8A2_9HYPO|nr:hypothetical protein FALBO_13385 [Fusarium albosuccineum]
MLGKKDLTPVCSPSDHKPDNAVPVRMRPLGIAPLEPFSADNDAANPSVSRPVELVPLEETVLFCPLAMGLSEEVTVAINAAVSLVTLESRSDAAPSTFFPSAASGCPFTVWNAVLC